MTRSAPVVIWQVKCEYIPTTTTVSNAFPAFLKMLFLLVSRLFIVPLVILPCLGTRLKWRPPSPKWQPYTKPAYHHTVAPDLNKHTHTSDVAFFCAGMYIFSHSQLSSTSDLLQLFRCIHNQFYSESISHFPCFSFDIQIELFTGCPGKQKELSVWVQTISLPIPLYLYAQSKIEKKSQLH